MLAFAIAGAGVMGALGIIAGLYMVDGFRYGFFGHGDVSPWVSLAIVVSGLFALSFLTLRLIRIGYKLRH